MGHRCSMAGRVPEARHGWKTIGHQRRVMASWYCIVTLKVIDSKVKFFTHIQETNISSNKNYVITKLGPTQKKIIIGFEFIYGSHLMLCNNFKGWIEDH